MSRGWWFCCLLSLAVKLGAQSTGPELNFSLLRQNDEIVPGTASGERSLYESLKLLRLSEATTLSFGGSYRLQTEGFVNQQFSEEGSADDAWFLHRVMAHAHLKVRDRLEVFGELNSSFLFGKDPLSPVDKDKLSVNQLFVRYTPAERWELTLGRQNVRLGSGRLIDVREGPNVRLSFDLAEVAYDYRRVRVRGLVAVPVRQLEGYFDNEYLRFGEEYLAGVYATLTGRKTGGIDGYLLYKFEEGKAWSAGMADDRRFSLGTRIFGQAGKFAYNNEFVLQWGTFGEQSIRAWTASFDVGYLTEGGRTEWKIGLKTEAISGDRTNGDDRLGTFDGLYPRGAYFGRVALFGPSNLIDLHPYVNASRGRWSLMLDYVAFWRFSVQDGSYGPPLNLQFEDTNDKRFIAHQFGTVTGYSVSRHLGLEVEANVVLPGGFLTGSNLDVALFHTVATVELKF